MSANQQGCLVTSYAIQMIIPQINPNGTVLVLAMTYTDNSPGKKPWTNARIPVETVKAKETFTEALYRGLEEEVYNREGPRNRTAVKGSFSFVTTTDDNRNQGGIHAKVAIDVEGIAHNEPELLRNVSQADDDDPHEIHGPIVSIEIGQLIRNGLNGFQLMRAHAVSLCAYLNDLSVRNREVALQYTEILSHPYRHTPPNKKCAEEIQLFLHG